MLFLLLQTRIAEQLNFVLMASTASECCGYTLYSGNKMPCIRVTWLCIDEFMSAIYIFVAR